MADMESLKINRVAVLGAGVMGAQIAAHLINAQIPVILYDLAQSEGDSNEIIKQAIKALAKLKPAPLAVPELAQHIEIANYEQDLNALRNCDLIIEAIAERMDLKQSLYEKISSYLSDQSIMVTNTSGLSIGALAQFLPTALRKRFCGVHFFNPPRYMPLVEIIPHEHTDQDVLTQLETLLVSSLGKSVVFAKDTPNFIANRIGVFSLIATVYHSEALQNDFALVDGLTGPLIGRPKSASYRTLDVVGLDTMGHVIDSIKQTLKDDPWHQYFEQPSWLQDLIAKGALGQKTKQGIYQKCGKEIQVLNTQNGQYELANAKISEQIKQIFSEKNAEKRFSLLRESSDPQAQFLWACFRDVFHYSAYHLSTIAHSVKDVDLALRWGFGWQQGPFETWQQANWQQVCKWIDDDIAKGKAMLSEPLPAWVHEVPNDQVYSEAGAYDPLQQSYTATKHDGVYTRQHFSPALLAQQFDEGQTIYETDAIRLWHQGDDIAILNYKTKNNTMSQGVIAGIRESVKIAEQQCKGLIFWQRHGEHFSYGADLKEFTKSLQENDSDAVYDAVHNFQKACMAVRYANIPTVAAVKGMVLGGSCELSMHCTRVVAAFETYMGLVEIGVGLLPAGAGSKELALRASEQAKGEEVFDYLVPYYMQVAKARVSNNAIDGKRNGLLRDTDVTVFNPHEILHVAKQQINALAESSYRAPLAAKIRVAGKPGIATIKTQLVNMREGGFIYDYDYYLGERIAEVMCGGQIEQHSIVDEQWLLRLEREAFVEFTCHSKTQERINYTMETGKPLRN